MRKPDAEDLARQTERLSRQTQDAAEAGRETEARNLLRQTEQAQEATEAACGPNDRAYDNRAVVAFSDAEDAVLAAFGEPNADIARWQAAEAKDDPAEGHAEAAEEGAEPGK